MDEKHEILTGPNGEQIENRPVAVLYIKDILSIASKVEYDFWTEVYPLIVDGDFLDHVMLDKNMSVLRALDTCVGLPAIQKDRFRAAIAQRN